MGASMVQRLNSYHLVILVIGSDVSPEQSKGDVWMPCS